MGWEFDSRAAASLGRRERNMGRWIVPPNTKPHPADRGGRLATLNEFYLLKTQVNLSKITWRAEGGDK